MDRRVIYLKIGTNRFLTVSSSTTWKKFNGAKNIGQQHKILAQKVNSHESKNKYGNKKEKKLVNKDFSGMVHS